MPKHIKIEVIDLTKWPRPIPFTPNHQDALRQNPNNRMVYYPIVVRV